MLSACMSTPWPSIVARRAGPRMLVGGPPAAAAANGVPFTTSATSGITQWAWTSMTLMRLPPIDTWRRTAGAWPLASPPNA